MGDTKRSRERKGRNKEQWWREEDIETAVAVANGEAAGAPPEVDGEALDDEAAAELLLSAAEDADLAAMDDEAAAELLRDVAADVDLDGGAAALLDEEVEAEYEGEREGQDAEEERYEQETGEDAE